MTGLTEAEFYKKYPTKEAFDLAYNNPKKYDLGGIVSGASSGASMGSALGPWGMLAGAVIGGAASQIKDVRQGNAELAGYDKQVSSSKLAYGGELPSYGKGGGIHINPANKGKFTATKKATGKTTEELTHSKNPLTRKRAIFAQNAAKWKHAYGGDVGKDANTPPSMSFDRNMPTTASLQTVIQKYRPADAYAAGGIIPDYKVGGLLEHAIGSNFYANGGKVKVSAGGQKHVVYKKESPTGNGKGVEGHIMVNHPSMDNGKWDTIDLTEKANAKTVAQGVAATKKWHEENPDAYAMGGYMYDKGGPMSSLDSIAHQADKILKYEVLRGGSGSAPLDGTNGNPDYRDPKYRKMLMDKIYPEVNKIMPKASAMEKGEAMDFIFNAGWDKVNNKIEKDPRGFALQEYYKQYDKSKLDSDSKWSGRKNAPYSFDKEYNATIGKLSENERRVLMNKGRDWYYQNINNPAPGVPSSDYNDTWYGRIWNTNDFNEFNPNNPKFIKKAAGGYLNGGNMTEYIGAGGTHEENPNEGVNIGDRGLVEEKEVKYNYKDETGDNSYIFSNRLGFAPKAKRIMKKFDVRDNDKLSVEAKQQRLDMLKDKQEVVRTKMGYKGKFDNQMPMAAYGDNYNWNTDPNKFNVNAGQPTITMDPNMGSTPSNAFNSPITPGAPITPGITVPTFGLPAKPKPGAGALTTPTLTGAPTTTFNPNANKTPNSNVGLTGTPNFNQPLKTKPGEKFDPSKLSIKAPDTSKMGLKEPIKRPGLNYTFNNKEYNPEGKAKGNLEYKTPEAGSKPPKKDFGTKLANFGQFAGSLAKFATSLQGGDPVNLERMQDARISSKPAEISAANELNQVYNAANTDIRNQAGSNAGSYLASRIASAGAQADKTGATMADIRSKYDQMNVQSGLTTGQFNALTQQKEDDLRTQERDRARTLGIEAAGQAGQTLGNIKKSENEQIAQDKMINAMSTQNWEWDPVTMKMVAKSPKAFGGYIKGFGGFMYKSKKKK